ncbi:MAG: DUF2158 domain-containing protein [Candidatus Paceibacterota bacterium]|jgi:uncharacterized protein YodC (DUF2158 family)
MKTIEINVGDVVQLKSGGPRMVVDKIDHNFYDHPIGCVWFNKNDEPKYSQFSHKSLNVLNVIL